MNPIIPQAISPSGLPKAKYPQDTFLQDATGKRHVSYGRRDIHIKEAEERLMTKYRMGYSQLHKYLVLKEGNNQFATPYL